LGTRKKITDSDVSPGVARDLRARGEVVCEPAFEVAKVFRARRPEVDGYLLKS
jgi:hypothetical protein